MKVAVRAGIASVRLGAYSQRRLNDYSTQMSSGFRRYIYIYIYFIIRSKTFRWHTIQIHLKKKKRLRDTLTFICSVYSTETNKAFEI